MLAAGVEKMKISPNARVSINDDNLWATSFYRFQNGDGTAYTVHICQCEDGGYYAIVNDSSLWMFFEDAGPRDIRFLCGNNNKFTRKALSQLLLLKEWIQNE